MSLDRILLVCSTSAHRSPLIEIGRLLKNSSKADINLLHFPSSITVGVPTELKEYVFSDSGVVAGEIFMPRTKALSGGGLQLRRAGYGFIKAIVNTFVGLKLDRFLFYSLVIWQLIFKAHGGIFSRVSAQELRCAIRRVWHVLERAMRWLPPPGPKGWGRLVSLVYYRIFFGLWSYSATRLRVDEFLSDIRPKLVILPELNWGYSHALLVNWCRRESVPLLIIPYTMAGRKEWLASFANDPSCQVEGIYMRMLARAFPDWVQENEGKRLMLPVPWLISCEMAGISPSIPWVSNSGPDGIVAADSNFTKRFYQREGVDTVAWHVIGSLAEDKIRHVLDDRSFLRLQLANYYGLASDRRWLLLAIPPDQYDLIDSAHVAYGTYHAMLREMVGVAKALAMDGWEVLINLHPRIERDSVDWLKGMGVVIVDRPVETLVPLADLFVASASATIRWAICAGVPVINYDVYRYRYDDYRDCPGVVEVDKPEAYRAALLRLLTEPDAWEARKKLQDREARYLFKVDGHASERLLTLVNSLLRSTG